MIHIEHRTAAISLQGGPVAEDGNYDLLDLATALNAVLRALGAQAYGVQADLLLAAMTEDNVRNAR